MSYLSLSTMWSREKYESMEEFVRVANQFGYTHLELYSDLSSSRLKELLRFGGGSISSVHSPCPYVPLPEHTKKYKLSLSSLDRQTQRAAVERSIATIELAARVGARAVVLHAGEVESAFPSILRLRELYDLDLATSKEFQEIKKHLIEERAINVEPHLEIARESISRLLSVASENGILLGLENRVHYHEIPSLEEMEQFMEDFSGRPIGYWHDAGHAEVQARLGFDSHKEWFLRLGPKIIGFHLHDVNGIHDHLAPGTGSLNWDLIANNIPNDAIKVCEIGEWNKAEDVRDAVSFLGRKGIINRIAQSP